MPYLSASAVVIHYEEALYQMYAPLPLPFDLETDVRVTCDVGYLCANFSLSGPLCSRVRPDVRDRQTSVRRQTSVKSIA